VSSLRGSRLASSEELRPYRVALGRLLPDWFEIPADGGGGPGADPVLVLGEGLLRLLRSIGGATGCVLLLEDLHWADADTLALVEYLAGAVRDSPVLVAASARDDWPGAAVDRLLSAEDVTTLRLTRLSAEEVGALAASRVGAAVPEPVRRLLVDRSDGVPFLVVELLAALPEREGSCDADADEPRIASMPRTFADLVAQRLALLTTQQQRFLAAAAVLGTDPDWLLLGRVSGGSDAEALTAVQGAAAAHLLVVDEGRLRWRHALTRDAVLATLLPPERAALARAAAQVLQARGAPGDEASAAELLTAAGEHDAAAAVLLRLAHQDLTRGALRSAAALLDRLTSMQARPTAVAIELVQLLTLTGRPLTALERGAAALKTATGDYYAELALRLARAGIAAGRWSDAERYVERAGRPSDPRSASLLADAAHGAGRVQAAAVHAATAVEQAERQGRPDAVCEALVIAAKVDRLGDVTASAAAFRRAAQVAAEHGLAPWRVEALLGLGTVELLETETSSSLPEARELALDAGLLAQVAQVDVLLAEHVLLADGPRAAAASAQRLLDEGTRLRLTTAQTAGAYLAATARAWTGDAQGMEELLGEIRDAAPEAAAAPFVVQALAAVQAHDLPRATALLDLGVGQLVGHASAAPLHHFGLWVLLRTVTGDRDAMARDRLRGLPVARRPANRGALHFADAVAAGRRGRSREAATRFAAGDETLSQVPWLRRLLRLFALEAAVVDGWGDPVPALRADLSEHERAGELQLARTCRDLLRRAGVPTRRGRGESVVPPGLRAVGVTSREMDVLTLLVSGRTNTEIAERLYLSPRTVETHVTHLLGKTGTANRSALRAWALAQTP
jgi:DNA-binding CsgD family transcriptional regulator